jgi:hypothetical protein
MSAIRRQRAAATQIIPFGLGTGGGIGDSVDDHGRVGALIPSPGPIT